MIKKQLLLILTLFLLPIEIIAQPALGPESVISVITYDPSETSVYAVYGHTAIRVKDPDIGLDKVYNYGTFDFTAPNFIYRFTKGETDYSLGVFDFKYLLAELEYRNCGAKEQFLNLTAAERNKIWQALLINARPENATYRYNFFYDNCATRPAAIIENNVDGKLIYHEPDQRHSFRQLINECMRNKPWLIFGTEIALGNPTDLLATPHEELFLPIKLEQALDRAVILQHDGTERRLVMLKKSVAARKLPAKHELSITDPIFICWGFLIAIIIISLYKRKAPNSPFVDATMALVAGMAGLLIFFLAFVSVHPATWPNYIVLWLHPFHLIAIPAFFTRKLQIIAAIYYFANFCFLIFLLVLYPFIPQHFNAAFFPLILAYLIRHIRAMYTIPWYRKPKTSNARPSHPTR